MLEKTYYCKI